MATLHTSAPPSHSIRVLCCPSAGVHAPFLIFITPRRHNCKAHLDLRSVKEVRLQVKSRWSPVFASNLNPTDGSDDTKTSDAASGSGPPFLTILAGVVIFLFICWIIGSVVTWLIDLILHPPPLK